MSVESCDIRVFKDPIAVPFDLVISHMGSDGDDDMFIPYQVESPIGGGKDRKAPAVSDAVRADLGVPDVLDREEFFQQDPHVFVVSWSGRPVFSHYELRDQQATLVAVIAALIENMHSLNDHWVSCISSRNGNEPPTAICISEQGPLYLAAVSRKLNSASLKSMLEFVYKQILLLLSQSAINMLQTHPGYDLRNLMGGVDKLLCSQLRRSMAQVAFEANSVPSLPLPPKTRSKLAQSMIKLRSSSSRILFILLLRGSALVQLVHSQGRPLPLSDCLLLITFANHMSAIEISDVVTPICLPEFNSKVFVYAHLSTIAERLYLIQITADSNDFRALQDYKAKLLEDTTNSGFLAVIRRAPMRLPLASLGINDASVRHIIAISRKYGQLVTSLVRSPYKDDRNDRRKCADLHRHTLAQLRSLPSISKVYLESRVEETLVAVRHGGLDVLAIMSSLISKSEAVQCIKKAAESIQDQESALFATKFAMWT